MTKLLTNANYSQIKKDLPKVGDYYLSVESRNIHFISIYYNECKSCSTSSTFQPAIEIFRLSQLHPDEGQDNHSN